MKKIKFKNMPRENSHSRGWGFFLGIFIFTLIFILGSFVYAYEPKILSDEIVDNDFGELKVDLDSKNLFKYENSPILTLDEKLDGTYESKKIYTSEIIKSEYKFNALGVRWQEHKPESTEITLEVRISNNDSWTEWFGVEKVKGKDEPENIEVSIESPILAEGDKIQYRVSLNTNDFSISPSFQKIRLNYINSQGNEFISSSKSLLSKITGIFKTEASGPTVISRAAWGCPDPNGTAFIGQGIYWPAEYVPVQKIIVHHTAGQNNPPDPAAAVRAIWQYHTYTNSWGDIGYNFLVDQYGNIYEGRFGGDNVVAGHAYGYNRGSMGVSLLGTFTYVSPSSPMINGLTNILAWKSYVYNINPQGTSVFIDRNTYNIAGHRDYAATACPGNVLYSMLPSIRSITQSKKPSGPELIVQASNPIKVYLVDNSTKRWVPSPEILYAWGLSGIPISSVSDSTFNSYSEGDSLSRLAQYDSKVYLMDSGVRKWVPSPEILYAWGFGQVNVIPISDVVANYIKTGNNITYFAQATGDSKVYLLDNGTKRYVSPYSTLQAWGFKSISDITFVSQSLLNSVQNGDNISKVIKKSSDQTNYLVDNGSKKLIPNETLRNAWLLNNEPISTVSDATFNRLQTGNDLTYFAQAIGDTKVYLLDFGTKRYIPSYSTLQSWGFNDISDISFVSVNLVNSFPTGSSMSYLFQATGDPKVYLIDSGTKRYIPTSDILVALGYNGSNISIISSQTLDRLPTGSTLTYLFQATGDSKVYLLDNGTKRYIPTTEILVALGYNGSNISTISAQTLSIIKTGSTLTYLFQATGNPVVYFLDSGAKRGIPTIGILKAVGFKNISDISFVSPKLINGITTGSTLTHLFQATGNPVVYFLDCGTKRGIPTSDILVALGYNGSNISTVSSNTLGRFPLGASIGSKVVYGTPNGTKLYLLENGYKRWITSPAAVVYFGYDALGTTTLSDSALEIFPNGSNIVVPTLVRVGLYVTSGSIQVTGNGSFTLVNANNAVMSTFQSGQVVTVWFNGSSYSASGTNGYSGLVGGCAKVIPASNTILQVPTFDSWNWNHTQKYDRFRGNIELRYTTYSDVYYGSGLWAINELPVEDYVKGIAEMGNSSPIESLKTSITAARTYAYRNIKYPKAICSNRNFHVFNDGKSQVYKGYAFEILVPNIVSAAQQTYGYIVLYTGDYAITAYSSDSGGITKDARVVWGSFYNNHPYLWGGRADPAGTVHDPAKIAASHGVGLSMVGVVRFGELGSNFISILNHYYPGVSVVKAY